MNFDLAAVTPSADGNVVCSVTHVHRTDFGVEFVVHVGEVNRTIFGGDMIDDGVGNAVFIFF